MRKIIHFLAIICLFSIASANTFASVTYSPYVDITIDTHWDSKYNHIEPLDLTAISASQGIQSYHLAFINDAGHCTPAWGGMSNISVGAAWGQHLTDKMTALGIKYIVGFGGSNGTDMSSACTQDQLTSVYEQVIYTYNPEGLDLDIENGTANVPKVIASLVKIQLAHPNLKISFTLPVMPFGFLSPQKSIIQQAKNAGLNFAVNIMTMDYSNDYTGDMGKYAIQALQSSHTYLQSLYPQKTSAEIWQMLQVTPQIGVNDIITEHFTLSNADELKTFATQQQIGGIFMWSLNRDKPCASEKNSMHCSGANLQTTNYEFSKHLK